MGKMTFLNQLYKQRGRNSSRTPLTHALILPMADSVERYLAMGYFSITLGAAL